MSDSIDPTVLQNAFAGRRVMVTGASGFLGRHLCRRLTEFDAELFAAGRGDQPDGIPTKHWCRFNWADSSQVQQAVAKVKPEILFHLAGVADGRRGREWVLPTLHGNLTATVHLLTAVADLGCQRILLAGSLEEPTENELATNPPDSPYAAAKFATSLYADLFRRLYALPVLTARIFMTYGPGQPSHKLIPSVISTLLRKGSLQIESGERLVDWIYVDDTVEGLLSLAALSNPQSSTYDVGWGQLYSVRDVVQRLANLLEGTVPLEFAETSQRGAERVAAANLEQTKIATGWSPQITLDQGLARTVESIRRGHSRS